MIGNRSRGAVSPALGAGFLVVLAALLVNLRALSPGFIHDDHRIIEQNELIRGFAHLPEIFARGYWSVSSVPVPILYRPVTILSFALNHALGGLDPRGYRAANLLLHALVSLLVYLLARRLLSPEPGSPAAPGTARPPDPALFAGLLFAVHPVHTEVLGEVVGRAELLAAAGVLGAVLLFLRARDLEGEGRPVPAAAHAGLSAAAGLLAFLAKENAVALPILLILADLLLVRRRGVRAGIVPAIGFHAVCWAALAVGLVLRRAALGGISPPGAIHFADNPIAHIPFWPGRLTALRVIGRYALLLVAPFRQSIDYSYDAVPIARGALEPGVVAGAAILAIASAAAVIAWRRAPATAFAIAWTGAAFAPVANLLFPIGTVMAERLLYLPSAGVCWIAAGAFATLRRRPGTAPAAAARTLAVVLLVVFAARSVARLKDWRDDHSIFGAALRVAPRSVRVLYNFGAACEDRGDDGNALRVYREAVSIWPDFADAHYNLAGVYGRRKEWAEAIRHYQEAIRRQPGNVRYLANYGHILNAAGRPAEARAVLDDATKYDPLSAEAWTNLGAAALATDDLPAAVRAYREALRLAPGHPDYALNLAGALLRSGAPGEAADLFGRAVAARPDQPIVRYQQGRALEQAGRPVEAAAAYRESIRLAPNAPVPLRALGLLLARSGDRDGAREALERAAALDPDRRVMDAGTMRLLRDLRAAHPETRTN